VSELTEAIHMAGIIPLVKERGDHNMWWHDSLIPIAPDYHAVERAVYECAMAGCNTIWIVADDDVSPLVRHRIGSRIQDPVYLGRKTRFPSEDRRLIPVYYVPIMPNHRNKKLCISWTIVQGALIASEVAADISKWLVPERFYVSFPYGVYDVKGLRQHRQYLTRDRSTLITFNNKSVKDGEYLGFVFHLDALPKLEKKFSDAQATIITAAELENQEQHFYYNFTLDKVFGDDILYESKEIVLDWYYPIDSWDAYCKYLGSEHRKEQKHPGKLIISHRSWNPVGVDR